MSRDPSEEQGGVNLYGFCGNNSVGLIDRNGQDFGLWIGAGSGYGNFLGTKPTPGEGDKWLWYQLIKWKGSAYVNNPLADTFLKHWIWGNGEEYHLSDSEFREYVWGYESYRTNNLPDNALLFGTKDSLTMDPKFMPDLQSKCKAGKSFSGTYYIPDYALAPGTLGHLLFIVEVTVDCKCSLIGTFGFRATGTVRVQDAWDFNPMDRIERDERVVAEMRMLQQNIGIGNDFPITSARYPIEEEWSGMAFNQSYLKRN